MIRKTLGGDRLGSGNKMHVDMHGYERSTHDLGKVVRTSMAAGTLIPIYNKPAQPGDTWSINLGVMMNTHPTLGPLYGSYKVQIDVFQTPIRLYNSYLHNNMLNIGMDMGSIKLPQIEIKAIVPTDYNYNQTNASSLLKYMGISGIGIAPPTSDPGDTYKRNFNAIPILTYWDIFKNYYSNKQEDNAYVIHTGADPNIPTEITAQNTGDPEPTTIPINSGAADFTIALGTQIVLTYDNPPTEEQINGLNSVILHLNTGNFSVVQVFGTGWTIDGNTLKTTKDGGDHIGDEISYWMANTTEQAISLVSFPLSHIDDMRNKILATPGNTTFMLTNSPDDTPTPYNYQITGYTAADDTQHYSYENSQEGLAVKAYQSDLLNNWIKTESYDYISDISAVDTTTGTFTMDALNMAQKVYNMLNRIAASDGTYHAWQETVYGIENIQMAETPVYCGSLIKELSFQELNSTATTSTDAGGQQPLGQLAGKGILTHKHKGGQIEIKVREWSYITIIASLTPRIDYSQGNNWDVNLQTMNDLHKPELDEIGFQDLITEQMAWQGTQVNDDGTITTHSAGKQPAWLNYMTDINQTYGSFAEPLNEMFMTLNRRYEIDSTTGDIQDITTYIDPTKYNFIFAETKLDAQNFWAQFGIDIECRRKISAKAIPNL